MAEGRTKSAYHSDILTMFDNATGASKKAQFAFEAANNLVLQGATLGYNVGFDATLPNGIRIPKRLKPRHVVGITGGGKRVKAIITDLTATLWATPGGTWTFIDNSGATVTATVTGLVGESATL